MIVTVKNTLSIHAKLIRHAFRRGMTQMKMRSGSLVNSPIFFANSFPKSGTHWLTQVMEALPMVGPAVDSGLPAVVMYEGSSGRERSEREILTDLSRFKPGDTGYGHLHARPEIINYLIRPEWCSYFIVRDPRDIVVSHVYYVADIEPNHVHHDYYVSVLKTFEERLRTSILGRPDAANPFPDIKGRFDPFLDWFNYPEVFCLKYEDAISTPAEMIHKILHHASNRGLSLYLNEPEAVQTLVDALDPRRSPTFRQGKSGGWRKHFTSEITRLFKDVAGDLLIQLGYEKDLNW